MSKIWFNTFWLNWIKICTFIPSSRKYCIRFHVLSDASYVIPKISSFNVFPMVCERWRSRSLLLRKITPFLSLASNLAFFRGFSHPSFSILWNGKRKCLFHINLWVIKYNEDPHIASFISNVYNVPLKTMQNTLQFLSALYSGIFRS